MEDMSSGAIYVEVTASQVNSGINLLSSGAESGGGETGTYWLYWTSAGGLQIRVGIGRIPIIIYRQGGA